MSYACFGKLYAIVNRSWQSRSAINDIGTAGVISKVSDVVPTVILMLFNAIFLYPQIKMTYDGPDCHILSA